MSDGTKAQIDLLAAFPEQLKRQIQGLDDAALRFRPAPDEWSIMELVGHIIDVGALWPGRTRQMLATDNPTLAAVDPAWVRQRDYHNKQPGFLLSKFSRSSIAVEGSCLLFRIFARMKSRR